jgi:hypothetical protein
MSWQTAWSRSNRDVSRPFSVVARIINTEGTRMSRLFAAYSLQAGRAVHTITGRLDNVTDELYRNHLSLIKDLAPEMGRNFKLLYNVYDCKQAPRALQRMRLEYTGQGASLLTYRRRRR